MALFIVYQTSQDTQGRGFVNRIGGGDVGTVVRNEMRFDHPKDPDAALYRVLPFFFVFDFVHKSDESVVWGTRRLCLATQLGQALAEGVAMERAFVNLARHLELDW